MDLPKKKLKFQSMQDIHDVNDATELAGLLRRLITPNGTVAFWFHRDGNPVVALLLNGRRAAIYRSSDDVWSTTPSYSDDEFDSFMLEIDQVPLSQCVSPVEGIEAFLSGDWKTLG